MASSADQLIWLLRHAEAEDLAIDDAARPLTAKGRRQATDAGRALVRLGVRIETCLTSPKVRAVDTAALACLELDLPEPEVTAALAGGDFDPAALAAGRGPTLLVGHEPDFSRAINLATGARVELKKGGIAAIEGTTLSCLLRPVQVRAIASTD